MSKYNCFYFGNPANKTVTKTVYSLKLLLIHLDQYYDRPIRNTEPQPGPIYYTLFWRCTTVLWLLPATARCTNLVQFRELNRHFWHFHINLTVLSHVLSTGGDALRWRCSKWGIYRLILLSRAGWLWREPNGKRTLNPVIIYPNWWVPGC
jgi:hypothetical protein